MLCVIHARLVFGEVVMSGLMSQVVLHEPIVLLDSRAVFRIYGGFSKESPSVCVCARLVLLACTNVRR